MRGGLGKGLSQLLGEEASGSIEQIAVGDIRANQVQPRTVFDDAALQELSKSLAEVGVIQPLVVRPIAEGKYELIAGERRWRAAQLAGLTHVPAIIRHADRDSSLLLAIVENVQREDLGSLDTARAYRKMALEFGLNQEQIADRVGKSRSAVANSLRLLKLPEEIMDGLEAGKITEGHARALLTISGGANQVRAFRKVVTQGLSVRETERLAPATRASKDRRPTRDPNVEALEQKLEQKLGAPVRVEGTERGTITIRFSSLDDLDRILERIL